MKPLRIYCRPVTSNSNSSPQVHQKQPKSQNLLCSHRRHLRLRITPEVFLSCSPSPPYASILKLLPSRAGSHPHRQLDLTRTHPLNSTTQLVGKLPATTPFSSLDTHDHKPSNHRPNQWLRDPKALVLFYCSVICIQKGGELREDKNKGITWV